MRKKQCANLDPKGLPFIFGHDFAPKAITPKISKNREKKRQFLLETLWAPIKRFEFFEAFPKKQKVVLGSDLQ